MSKKVQNIRQSHKVNHGNHEKLDSGYDRKRKTLAEVKTLEINLPRRYAFTITIFYRDDAYLSYTNKITTNLLTRKKKSTSLCIWTTSNIFAKNKRK